MRRISSHRDLRGSKMRFLIVSALFACAAAAPSGVLAPVAAPIAVPAIFPSAIPTLSPGDLQAAAIDAQVKAQDLAQAAADKARELTELSTENLNEKVVSNNDLVKEKVVEDFWSVEDKKWQTLDAIKTAEAQIDGSVASNADVLAKSAVIIPYPIAPVVYPGIVAPVVKTAEVKEEKKEELVKSAEVKEEKKEDKDSVAVEAKPEAPEIKPLLASVYTAPLAIAEPYRFPIVAPIAVAPLVNYGAVQHIGLTPYIAKSAW